MRRTLDILWLVTTAALAAVFLWPLSPVIAVVVILCFALWAWVDPLAIRRTPSAPARRESRGSSAADKTPSPAGRSKKKSKPKARSGSRSGPKAKSAPVRPSRRETVFSEGSGFFVDTEGTLVTNHHVVEDAEEGASIWVEHGRRRYPLTIEAVDPELDLALCSSNIKKSTPAAFREDGLVRLGERCIAAGFPRQQAFTITDGMVSKLSGENDKAGLLQMSAPVHPGSSGGPLLDRFGNIIGIVVATLDKLDEFERTRHIAENIHFAVRLDALRDFLDQAGVEYFVAPNDDESNPEEIAAEARLFTARISVSR